MKKIFLIITVFISVTAFAQSEKYIESMSTNIKALDTVRNAEDLKNMAHTFERIGDAEKTQWHPYYYAALATTNLGYGSMTAKGGDPKVIDPIADKAEALIKKAEELSKNNSEVHVVKKMIATLRMMADPMNRYMKYGPEAQQQLEMAKKMNPNNPRVYMLEGQDKFYTPEQFGGSKEEAKKLFTIALEKYDASKQQDTLDPTWGRKTAEGFLKQIN